MSEPGEAHDSRGDDTSPEGPSILGEFVPELADVFERLLGLGAAMARTVAQATDPSSGSGSGPIDEIVRSGAGVVANLVRLTVGSLRASTVAPSPPGHPAAQRGAAPLPVVRAGDTLRMPLFIENPSPEPTGPLRFQALGVTCLDPEGGLPLSLAQVRCNPDALHIDGKDFEKLTVYVDTDPATTSGRHRVQIGVPDSAFVTTVEFEVAPAG